jgi:hypothetical protein
MQYVLRVPALQPAVSHASCYARTRNTTQLHSLSCKHMKHSVYKTTPHTIATHSPVLQAHATIAHLQPHPVCAAKTPIESTTKHSATMHVLQANSTRRTCTTVLPVLPVHLEAAYLNLHKTGCPASQLNTPHLHNLCHVDASTPCSSKAQPPQDSLSCKPSQRHTCTNCVMPMTKHHNTTAL